VHQGPYRLTLHLRVSGGPLRYNSPDCPVGHRTVRCARGATAIKRNGQLQWSLANVNSARTVHAESEQCQKAHQTVNNACPVWTGLSGAPRCHSSNGRNHQNPNGWVTWLAHRTVSGAPIDRQPPPTVGLVVGDINTQNHHHSKHPSFSDISFNTRASAINTRHNSIKPLQVPNPLHRNSD
jgi:hypothetical protein